MARFLEYDKTNGRIISEIFCAEAPEASAGIGLLEIDADAELDTNLYAVKNGVLVKQYETNEERIERIRLRQEQREKVRKRIKSMVHEVIITILENDADALEALREEYRTLKAYL